jgi:hypothetical protein
MAESRKKIPADIRRAVLIEASHRCAIPRCQNSANIDLHHIDPWGKCKEHKAENLIVLCPNCHRLAHDGSIDKKSLLKYKEICHKLTNPPAHHENSEVKAYIKFNPNTVSGILDASNISSFTDHGVLNFSFNFLKAFEDESYVINAIGDGSVSFRVMEKGVMGAQVLFDTPCPNIVRMEFRY